MPGVYRDDSGQYTYQSNNAYEDRRRDDWDRRYGSLRPNPPPAPAPFTYYPPPAPAPAPPPQAPPPIAILQPPAAVDFSSVEWQSPGEFSYTVPQVAEWPGATVPERASVVDFHELNRFVAQLPDPPDPPARVGDFPEFDAAFDRLTAAGKSITYESFQNSVLAPTGTEWVAAPSGSQ